VAVVGGGVIGLCVAEALARRGADVVLLEARSCGAAASAGNAGWVTPGLSNPVAAPGTVAKGLRWMLSPRGPLRVRPNLRPSFVRWVYDFWRSCSPRRYAAGIGATVALSRRALDDFDGLAARVPQFEMHSSGVLFVSASAAALEAETATLRQLQGSGYEGEVEVLDRDAALAAEPALAPDVAGAILTPAERHVRPETLTAALVSHLREQGVELREGEMVTHLGRRPGGWALGCTGGEIAARRVVLAGGAETATLLRPLGVRLPMEGAKGYSLTQDSPAVRLRRPVYLLDSKVAVSPFDDALRLAGTLELGTSGLGVDRRRVAGIEAAARCSFSGWSEAGEWTTWAGLRPLLPDGLPALGPVPGHPDLHLATGHSMLGVTLAPTTAAVLAPVILDGSPSPELAPFSIARFAKRGGGRCTDGGDK
jgi:D-amino-acid dehydrogenase